MSSDERLTVFEFEEATLTGGFCQNLGLDPDFGHDRQKKQPRFESETKCRGDRSGRRLDLEPRVLTEPPVGPTRLGTQMLSQSPTERRG